MPTPHDDHTQKPNHPASGNAPMAEKPADSNATPKDSAPRKTHWLALGIPLLLSAAILALVIANLKTVRGALEEKEEKPAPQWKFLPPAEGSWRFIVSGDSRNCGDVVMPAIAAHSAEVYQPSFYWHLGDLRAIYKIDEDMAAADLHQGRYLGCEAYVKRAWPDYIEHQIAAFGSTPFYVGIGNHEVIPPKDGSQFTAQFADWLLAPAIKDQRLKDQDCDKPPASDEKKKTSASGQPKCSVLPRNYYHWVQGGVDFIYLDNAANVLGPDQLAWFNKRIDQDETDATVHSIVVGMHEALPRSISSDHSMCDVTKKDRPEYGESCKEGDTVYDRLLSFQRKFPERHVYTLASHSHYYMAGIFGTRPESERLPGWIVGTAGAVRYPLPEEKTKSQDYRADVYGYLVGTVDKNGSVTFAFQEVKQEAVPPAAAARYAPAFVDWCFAHNSENLDPHAPETTNRCLAPK